MKLTASEAAAALERIAAEREALADSGCLAMDELGPTAAQMQRRIAAGYRDLAAKVRGDEPVVKKTRDAA